MTEFRCRFLYNGGDKLENCSETCNWPGLRLSKLNRQTWLCQHEKTVIESLQEEIYHHLSLGKHMLGGKYEDHVITAENLCLQHFSSLCIPLIAV